MHINCYTKAISFLEFSRDEDLLVTARQVNESLKKEAQVSIVLTSLKAKGKGVIGNIPVMCGFLEVFLDDINDFPLEWEVEFSIDLVPGISPLLMAPYRMSASELSEMKKHLEDFLEKNFI